MMFRSSKGRSAKNNSIKSVFKLQFHATQVLQLGVDALTVLAVPLDVGKPTVRLDKVAVKDGSCQWPNPVYEPVKFFRNPKTGKINEKPYRFVVSTGSSKGCSIGEVSFDFACYAEATKASNVSLALENSKSNVVLHVSIQRVQENVDHRAVKDCEGTKSMAHDRSLRARLRCGNSDEIEEPFAKTTHNVASNGDCSISSGSDIRLSSSESSSGLDTPREFGIRNIDNHKNPTVILSKMNHDIGGCKDESNNNSQDTEIESLRSEVVDLVRKVEVSELELQALRKQILKEVNRGQALSREVISLKEERDTIKGEYEKFKSFQNRKEESKNTIKLCFEDGDPCVLLNEVRQELGYERDLNLNRCEQLEKIQESNAELILAVQGLETENLAQESGLLKNARETKANLSRRKTDDDAEQKALEELVKGHRDASETYFLGQKVMDFQSEGLICKRYKDELEMQIEQLALDYEILRQENHGIMYKLEQSELKEQLKLQYEYPPNKSELELEIENLEIELNKQSQQYSASLAIINELEYTIESLEEDLERQARGFEADVNVVISNKVELEIRVIRTEEALRIGRLKNTTSVERLQEELKILSVQVASAFDANEKVAVRSMAEASELRLYKSILEEMLHKAKEELQLVRHDYEAQLCNDSKKLYLRTNQVDQTMFEIKEKYEEVEHQMKHEKDVDGSSSPEILIMKAEIKELVHANSFLSEKAEETEKLRAEIKILKASFDKVEVLLQKGSEERKEAEKSLGNLHEMEAIKLEKEREVAVLQAELKIIKSQLTDLKNNFTENEPEKEKLRKQVNLLEADNKKKEDALNTAVYDAAKPTSSSRNHKSSPVSNDSKEVANLKEKIKLLERDE